MPHRPTSLLLLATVLAAGPLPAAPAADEPPPGAPLHRLTLDLKHVPLRQALEIVCMGSGLKYEVEAGVPDVAIDLSVQDLPVRAVVRRLVRAAAEQVPGLDVQSDPDSAILRVRRGPARSAQFRGPGWRVSLTVRDVPLRRAVEALFADVDSACIVEANVPDVLVTVVCRDVTLESAVWLLTGAASSDESRVIFRREAENYVLGVAPRPVSSPPSAPTGNKPRPAADRTSLVLNFVPLRRALAALSPDPEYRWIVEKDVPDVRVALRLSNLPLEGAVKQVTGVAALRAPGLTYTRAGKVFVFSMRDPTRRPPN